MKKWFAVSLLLAGCSHDFELMKMEEQVSGYGAAIRWNQFKKAAGYLDPVQSAPPDWKALNDIQITSYNVQFRDVLPSGKVMMQTAEIHYIPAGSLVEKTLIDQQRWHQDEDSGRWMLESGLPQL